MKYERLRERKNENESGNEENVLSFRGRRIEPIKPAALTKFFRRGTDLNHIHTNVRLYVRTVKKS